MLEEIARENQKNLREDAESRQQTEALRQQVHEHQAFYENFVGDATITERNYPESEATWVSRQWLEEWASGMWALDTGVPSIPLYDDVLCEHGRLNPEHADTMKRLKRSAFMQLLDQYGLGEADVLVVELCTDCSAQLIQSEIREDEDNAKKQDVLAMISHKPQGLELSEQMWLPKAWVSEWRKKDPHPEKLGETINEMITCEHGELHPDENLRRLIPVEAWDYIASTYPAGTAFVGTAESCTDCASTAREQTATMLERKQYRGKERRALQSLYKLVSTGRTRASVPEGLGSYCWLTFGWLDNWAQYLENLDIDAVEPINTDRLLCEHGQLIFDPLNAADYSEWPLAVVPEEMFNLLVSFHGFEGSQQIKSYRSKTSVDTNLPTCPDCSAKQKASLLSAALNFEHGSVTVTTADASSGGRTRRTRGRTKSCDVPCSSTTTVRELAVFVLQSLDISTNLQLNFNGQQLPINNLPLSHYAVQNGSTIEISFSEDSSFLDLIDETRGPESGFFGSGLVNTDGVAPSIVRQECHQVSDDEDGNQAFVEQEEQEEEDADADAEEQEAEPEQKQQLQQRHRQSSRPARKVKSTTTTTTTERQTRAPRAASSKRDRADIDVYPSTSLPSMPVQTAQPHRRSEDQWTCTECSFDNSPFLNSCEICDSLRRTQS